MGATGTAILDFGNAPGTNQVSATVTGQTGILSASSYVEAWLCPVATATHNLEEIKLMTIKLGVLAHTISNGVGFTITGTTELRLTGTINVNWVWT
jgi:hypothetical protein